jgi:hypothetical protein
MRPVNPSGLICADNPLRRIDGLAAVYVEKASILQPQVRALVIDLMGGECVDNRNVIAFSVLCAELTIVIAALTAFVRADCGEVTRDNGVIDFLWAYSFDAYNHACDVIGDHAERRKPVAYAHLVSGFYRAMVEHIRGEMASSREVLQ